MTSNMPVPRFQRIGPLAALMAAMLQVGALQAQTQLPLDARVDIHFRDAQQTSLDWTDPALLWQTHTYDSLPNQPGIFYTSIDFARSRHEGAVSAAQQTLRAFNELSLRSSLASGAASTDTKTFVGFSKTVLVDAGTSGLALGAPVTLSLSVQLHGINQTGYMPPTPPPGTVFSADWSRILTSIDSVFDYRMVDQSDLVCDEGCRPRELARFGYSSRLIYDAARRVGGTDWSIQERSSWDAFGSVSGVIEGPYVNDYQDGSSVGPGSVRRELDTGVLTLQFDTFVGHVLGIRASMDLFNQSFSHGLAGSALGDFRYTFDADLFSSVAGLQLIGETPGMASIGVVPEPASALMLLAGLLGLAGLRSGARRARSTP